MQLKMNKAFVLFSVLIIMVSCYSCKSILLKMNGVSKPQLETPESILAYMSENSFDHGDGLFTGKDSSRFFLLLNMITSLPSIDFYNPKGELIAYSKTGDCTGQAEIFSAGLTPDALYKIDEYYHFKDVIEKVNSIDGKSKLSTENADFTVLIFWSKYLGKMNRSVMKVKRVLQDNKKIRTNIYLINMDFQRDWGLKAIPEINLK
jgi:hypothetical protein